MIPNLLEIFQTGKKFLKLNKYNLKVIEDSGYH